MNVQVARHHQLECAQGAKALSPPISSDPISSDILRFNPSTQTKALSLSLLSLFSETHRLLRSSNRRLFLSLFSETPIVSSELSLALPSVIPRSGYFWKTGQSFTPHIVNITPGEAGRALKNLRVKVYSELQEREGRTKAPYLHPH
ncbi:Uncharacterized protein Rs2_34090 [Raphanus sativus]|nr:Uncharacterized protein Rs2_34090 [Raphanus sativus]